MRTSILLYICLILICPFAVHAKTVVFEEQYIYDASEADSKLTCRTMALLQVKQLLLEKLGTYIESSSEIVNYQLTKDQITSLSAGIVKTEIIDEEWNGKMYSLKARIEADPNAVAKAVEELRNSSSGREQIEKLESINKESVEKIQELKDELERIQSDLITVNRDFGSASEIVNAWGSYEAGLRYMREGNFDEAIAAFDKAIETRKYHMYFYFRGKTYMKSRKYKDAIRDFDKAIELEPNASSALFDRGRCRLKIKEYTKGGNDIRRAAELGNGNAKRWLKLRALKRKKRR